MVLDVDIFRYNMKQGGRAQCLLIDNKALLPVLGVNFNFHSCLEHLFSIDI